MLRIVTWNINGIRSMNKSTIKTLLDSFNADIICLQETKITRNLLPDYIANVEGYYGFFSFSKAKQGYSGVVTYCKKLVCPIEANEGITGILHSSLPAPCFFEFSHDELKSLDSEGRCIITTHQTTGGKYLTIINVYCPRADQENIERYKFKMDFYKVMETKCKSLLKNGNDVIILGDLNVSHQRIDHCDPDEDFDSSPAREWIDRFLVKKSSSNNDTCLANDTFDTESNGTLIDSFRFLNESAKGAFTCWNTKIRARETNYGTRIDYILCNTNLFKKFIECRMRPDVEGSDHCPVESDIKIQLQASTTIPDICSVNMPEFAGKQQTIKSYFTKRPKRTMSSDDDVTIEKSRKIRKMCSLKNFFKAKPTELACKDSKTVKEAPSLVIPNKTDDLDKSGKFLEVPSFVSNEFKITKNNSWKKIFKGTEPAPVCSGHKEPSVLRTVKKEGPNFGKQFYVCKRPKGHASNKEASCNFFVWKK